MKKWTLFGVSLLLAGCQGVPAPLPVILKPKPAPEKVVELPKEQPAPVKPQLALLDDSATLSAWQSYRGDVLQMNSAQRDAVAKTLEKTPVGELQSLLLRIHPDTLMQCGFGRKLSSVNS